MKAFNFCLSWFFALPLMVSSLSYVFLDRFKSSSLYIVNGMISFITSLVSLLWALQKIEEKWSWRFSFAQEDLFFFVGGGSVNQVFFTCLVLVSWFFFVSKALWKGDESTRELTRFYFYCDLFLLAFFWTITSDHFVSFLLGWELTAISVYLLIVLLEKYSVAHKAAFRLFLIDKFCFLFFLFAFVYTLVLTSCSDFSSAIRICQNFSFLKLFFFIPIFVRVFYLEINPWREVVNNTHFFLFFIGLGVMVVLEALVILWKLDPMLTSAMRYCVLFGGMGGLSLSFLRVICQRDSLRLRITHWTAAHAGVFFILCALRLHHIIFSWIPFVIFYGLFFIVQDDQHAQDNGGIKRIWPLLMVISGGLHAFSLFCCSSFFSHIYGPLNSMKKTTLGAVILLLTWITWRNIFLGLFQSNKPLDSHREKTNIHYTRLPVLVLTSLVGSFVYGICSSGVSASLMLDAALLFGASVFLGGVLGGIGIIFLKNFGVLSEKKISRFFFPSDRLSIFETVSEFFFNRPFKFFSKIFSQSIDLVITQEISFPRRIIHLKHLYCFLSKAQSQIISSFLILLLLLIFVILSCIHVKYIP